MNSLLSSDFLIQNNDILSSILSIPNNIHDKKEDAQYKWVGIIDAYNKLNIPAERVLDIGCGFSSLPLYFAQRVKEVYAVEPGDIHDHARILKEGGVNLIQTKFELSDLPSNYFDVITDACSMGCSMHLDTALEIAYDKLKPGGYLISVGDSCLNQNTNYFASPMYWKSTAEALGFHVGDLDIDETDKFFIIYNNYKLYISRIILQKPL
jgi:SAM-dependent methyltransferase